MLRRKASRTATPNEVAVVSAVLHASGDPRAESLLRQFAVPGRVVRHVSGPHLRVALDLATSDLRVDLDEDLRSEPVRVFDETSGTALTFSVHLAAGGFLQALTGEAEGTAWPELWSVHPQELARAAEGALRLPARQPVPVHEVAQALGAWEVAHPERVSTRPPVAADVLVALENAQEAELPPGVAGLLLVSDGLVVPPVTVFGAAELYLADVPGLGHRWAVGATGRDGVLVWDDARGVLRTATPAEPASWVAVAGSYEDWVQGLLASC